MSYYHCYTTHMGFKGSFDEFFGRFLKGEVQCGSWFRHVRGWWEHRDDANVLFLRYEELTADLPDCLRRISAFCGLEVAPQRWPDVLERCGFAFMKQHESQFDPALESLWEAGVKLSCFLRNGRVGEGAAQLDGEQQQRFDRALARRLGSTGLDFGPEARKCP